MTATPNTPGGEPRANVYTVLRYAADKLASGEWTWHRGDGSDDLGQWNDTSGRCCILTAITRAARECDAIQTAYPAVKHVQWYVIDALRGSALLS